jgi:hypothetical protein
MKRHRAIIWASILCVLLCVPLVQARNYAVLISAGQATADNAMYNSEFWYDMLLQYMTLLDEGYSHQDITVLYGFGLDFPSQNPNYRPPYRVSDYAVNRRNIETVFRDLSEVMTPDDFLYVWWMGHGGPSGGHLIMSIQTTGEYVWDYEFARWVGQISEYDVRSFSFMTCYSGGILDDLEEEPRSIVMSSSTFQQSSYSDWLCDTCHAEFHYYETEAFHWETPFAICGAVDADRNWNGSVSFMEAFKHADESMLFSDPQMSDLDRLAPTTYLCDEWVLAPPQEFRVVEGEVVSGGLEDLLWRDDRYLVLRPSPIGPPLNPPVRVVVNGFSLMHSVSALRFTLEAHEPRGPLKQVIELFSYITGSWEQLDSRYTTLEDQVVKVFVDNPWEFIHPQTGEMSARLSWWYGPIEFWPVRVHIDQTVWELLP